MRALIVEHLWYVMIFFFQRKRERKSGQWKTDDFYHKLVEACALLLKVSLMCHCKLSRFTKYIGCAQDQINKTEDSWSQPRRPLPSNSKPLKRWFTEHQPQSSEQWHCLVSTLLSDSTMTTVHLKRQTFLSTPSPSLTNAQAPFTTKTHTYIRACV